MAEIGRAAVQLVTEVGLAGASMSALAHRAGISRTNLYHYVPDVSTAVREHFARQSEEYFLALRAAVDEEDGSEAKLRRYVREQMRHAGAHDHRVAMAFMAHADGPATLGGAVSHPHSDVLDAILAGGVADGTFRPGPVAIRAAMIHGLLHAVGVAIADGTASAEGVSSAEGAADDVTAFILRGLTG